MLDVDGTLVSFKDHRVPSSAIDAIRQAHDNGILVFIATGRTCKDLHELKGIAYDGVISLNGSVCVLADGTDIKRHVIPQPLFERAFKIAQRHGFPIALSLEEGAYIDHVDQSVFELARTVAHPVPTVADLEKLYPQCQCSQLCFYCDVATEQEIMPLLPELAAGRWSPIFADINLAGINKGTGVMDVTRHFGLNLSQVMAIGDGGNDIPMLSIAGIGVAMGNAAKEVQETARHVTTTVDDDGIANAFRHFGLI